MSLIRTGMQLGQAVKNVQRLKQIVGTFAKYGFGDVINRMTLSRFLPGQRTETVHVSKSTPERIRLAMEELGPTFVKFGQLLSTRPDLLPESYLEEFTRLQDNVQPLSFAVVKAQVERELGKKIDEAFAFFSEKPLASASIGQVHEARLHTGEVVVVKVQRPDIEKPIETDVSILDFLAGLLEKYVPETRVIGPRTVVEEFFRTLRYELDFAVEANNTVRAARNMAAFPDIVIPKVYKHLSTHRILTLEKIDGIRVNDLKALDAAHVDRKKVVDIGARAFFKSVMIDGFFHGDLHGGNWFILPDNRIGIIDFGIVGRLSERSRDQLATIVSALLSEDYEKLCYQYAELGAGSPSIDFESFQREVRNTLSPYLGLPLEEINAGKVLIEATQIATRYNIKVPGDWMLVFKAILTIEGIGRTLDPSFDFLATGQDLVKDLVKEQYSLNHLSRDLLWISKDLASVAQGLPRQVRWFIRKLNANDFAIEIRQPDLEPVRRQLDLNGRRMSSSILVAGLFLSSALSLHAAGPQLLGYSVPAVLFFAAGCFFLLGILLKSLK